MTSSTSKSGHKAGTPDCKALSDSTRVYTSQLMRAMVGRGVVRSFDGRGGHGHPSSPKDACDFNDVTVSERPPIRSASRHNDNRRFARSSSIPVPAAPAARDALQAQRQVRTDVDLSSILASARAASMAFAPESAHEAVRNPPALPVARASAPPRLPPVPDLSLLSDFDEAVTEKAPRAAGRRLLRPPSTLDDSRAVPTTGSAPMRARPDTRGSRTGELPPRASRGIGLRGTFLIAVAVALATLSLRELASTWWTTVAAMAAVPALALAITSCAARVFAWMRLPRLAVVVLAGSTATVALLTSAFYCTWCAHIGGSPLELAGSLELVPAQLSERLAALTQLGSFLRLVWWAALLLAVTASASMAAARVARRRVACA